MVLMFMICLFLVIGFCLVTYAGRGCMLSIAFVLLDYGQPFLH